MYGPQFGGSSDGNVVEVAVDIVFVVVLFNLDEIPGVILMGRRTAFNLKILRCILKSAAVVIADVAWSKNDIRLMDIGAVNAILCSMNDRMGGATIGNLAGLLLTPVVEKEGIGFYQMQGCVYHRNGKIQIELCLSKLNEQLSAREN